MKTITSPDLSSAKQLLSFIERIENLEQEKAAIASDIKAVYDEAEGTGLDKKVIRKIVSWRKKSDEERSEEDNLFQLYLEAIESLKNQRTITTDNVIKITA